MKYFHICLKVVPSFYIFCLFLWFRLLMSQIWLQFFDYSSNFIITSDYTFIILYKNYLALTYFSHFLSLSIALFTKFSKIPLKKRKKSISSYLSFIFYLRSKCFKSPITTKYLNVLAI